MATRVKVVCSYKDSRPGISQITFNPVYSGSEENSRFFRATPGGQFAFYTVNDEAAAQFEMGKEYYFDIFSADPQTPEPVAEAPEPVAEAPTVDEIRQLYPAGYEIAGGRPNQP